MVGPQEVERRLNAIGAFWACDMDDYHQVWITSWGFSTIVPMIGPNRECPEEALEGAEQDIRDSRPPNA